MDLIRKLCIKISKYFFRNGCDFWKTHALMRHAVKMWVMLQGISRQMSMCTQLIPRHFSLRKLNNHSYTLILLEALLWHRCLVSGQAHGVQLPLQDTGILQVPWKSQVVPGPDSVICHLQGQPGMQETSAQGWMMCHTGFTGNSCLNLLPEMFQSMQGINTGTPHHSARQGSPGNTKWHEKHLFRKLSQAQGLWSWFPP